MTSVQTGAETPSPSWSLFGPSGAGGRVSAVRSPEQIEEARQFAHMLTRETAAGQDSAQNSAQNSARYAGPTAEEKRTAQAASDTGSAARETVAYLPTVKPEDRWEGGGQTAKMDSDFFGDDGLTFADVVDIVNPLQHLPVISGIYRSLTGDEMSDGARLAGDALYGGPVGLGVGLANTIVEDATGKDIGGTAMAALFGSEDTAGAALAAADSPADAATKVAEIAPASGMASGAAAQSAAPVQMAQAAPKTQARATSPLFAAQPTGAPLASNPGAATSLIPPLPGGAPNVLTQTAQARQPQAPQTPMTAAGQGVPNLSPDAANVLMRMAQASQPQAAMAPATAPPVGPTAMAAPSEAPSEVAPAAAPKAPVSTASSKADPVQTASAEFVEPMPVENLPAAMMEALSRYEALKQGG